jgi:hypothetical protein
MRSPLLELAVADLARRQHGVFTRAQAAGAGMSDRQIDHRIDTSRWLRIVPGVYALPGNEPTWHRQVIAAELAEPRAAASIRSAAVLHHVDGVRKGRPEITVPRGANHRSRLATVHQSDLITTTKIDGIPVTTLEQTVVDLAATLTTSRLEAVVDGLVTQRRTTIPRLAARVHQLRRHNRPGLARLESILVARSSDAWVPPSSVLEAALYELLDELGIAYVRQPCLPWRSGDRQRLDALIDRWKLIVEAGGRAWHTRTADFPRDRRRDHEALAHGYLFLASDGRS